MQRFDTGTIIFQRLIDLPNSNCVFCSAIDNSSGRMCLFLVFRERQRIYVRNSARNTWDEIKDKSHYAHIRDRFDEAVLEQSIPCFST